MTGTLKTVIDMIVTDCKKMLGIVVLNYNTWDESVKCCKSIIDNTTIPFKIYLVDNCSPMKATVSQERQLNNLGVSVIYNKLNQGYAAGNNIGLKLAYADNCDYFLISNSDVIVTDNSIERMVEFLEDNPNVGIVGPVIYDRNGKRQPILMLSKLTANGKIKNMLLRTPLKPFFSRFEKEFIMYDLPQKPLKVFSVSGCCFLISKECYKQVFPFDEHTFLYEEEYILGCRLEKTRIEAYVIPNARVIHAEGVSTGGISKFSYRCLMESEQHYLKEYVHSNFFIRFTISILRRLIWLIRYKRINGYNKKDR